jgi:hypothetical protein
MPLSKKLRSNLIQKKKSKKKKVGSQKLHRQIMRGGGHPEDDVFQTLQMSAIFNNEYTYPELIFQDNVALYEKLIEYGRYNLTNNDRQTFAHIRNVYLCIFLNRPKIFKLLFNNYMYATNLDKEFSYFDSLRRQIPYSRNSKVGCFSSSLFGRLDQIRKHHQDPPKNFWSDKKPTGAGLIWEVIFALGRFDILNAVKDDILDKKKIREILSCRTSGANLTVLDIIVPKGKEGDKIVQLLTSDFYIERREISRFDLPYNLFESSINKDLTDLRYISTPPHEEEDEFLRIAAAEERVPQAKGKEQKALIGDAKKVAREAADKFARLSQAKILSEEVENQLWEEARARAAVRGTDIIEEYTEAKNPVVIKTLIKHHRDIAAAHRSMSEASIPRHIYRTPEERARVMRCRSNAATRSEQRATELTHALSYYAPSHTDPSHTDPSHTDPSHTDPSHTDPSQPPRSTPAILALRVHRLREHLRRSAKLLHLLEIMRNIRLFFCVAGATTPANHPTPANTFEKTHASHIQRDGHRRRPAHRHPRLLSRPNWSRI